MEESLNNVTYVSTVDDLSTIASNASDALLVLLPGSHEVEGLPLESDLAYIGAPGATLSLPSSPSTHLFEAATGATIEGGVLKNRKLDSGGTTTYDAIHLDDTDRFENGTIENNYVHDFCRGYSGSQNDRKPDLEDNRFWDNEVGVYVNGNHPVMLKNDIRNNDVGVGGDIIDLQSTAEKYNYNRVCIQGLDGGSIDNSQFDNCHFYQCTETVTELGNNSSISGGLLILDDSTGDVGFVAAGTNVTVEGVTARPDVDTTIDTAVVRIEGQACTVRDMDAHRVRRLVTGGGSSNLRGVKISGNTQVIDNTDSQLVDGTTDGDAWLIPDISNNTVRCFADPSNPIVDLPDDGGFGLGFVMEGNVIYGDSGASGDYIAGETGDAVIQGNRAHRITGQTLSGTPESTIMSRHPENVISSPHWLGGSILE